MKIYKIFGTIAIAGLILALVSLMLKPTNTPFLTDLGMSIMVVTLGCMGIYTIWKTKI
jgi:hypothetical protein